MSKKYPQIGAILRKLLFERNIKAADLARSVKLPPPTIHRLITGKSTRPYMSSIGPIADYFAITPEQLLGEQPLPGEDKLGSTPTANQFINLPFMPWENLSTPLYDNTVKTIPFAGNISEEGFATAMPDSSMEPIFSRDSILIFDPQKPAKDRSYVLVQLAETNLPVFRQLLIDLEHKYLKPLNPDLNVFRMRLLNEKDTIIAVLVEARQVYNDA